MPDVWTAPSKPPVFNVGTVLLLTDGTLFAQDDFTTSWWRLRPDNSGDYSKGVWTQAASARQARRYFASAVLADGRVFVAGGKTMQAGVPTDLLAAEIYDPVTDRWEDLPVPAGWNEIGNAPCCVLPNGTVLLGNITTGACAIYDPDTNAWRPTGSKGNLSARAMRVGRCFAGRLRPHREPVSAITMPSGMSATPGRTRALCRTL